MTKKFLMNNQDSFYSVFRIIVGIVFLLHGWMKVANYMNGNMALSMNFISILFGLATVIEVVGGVFLILGFKVRQTAALAAVEMFVAFLIMHLPNGVNPLANGGEAAVLFFAAFLVLAGHGAGKWSVDSD